MHLWTWTVTLALVCLISLSDVTKVECNQHSNDDIWGEISYSVPSTPRPQDVNCYVEVPSVRRVGGTCGRMGIWYTCKAGPYLAPNARCESIMRNRGTHIP